MAGTSLGSAYVQIVPQAKGIQGAISNVLGGEAESAGTSAGGKIAAFAKKAILAAGIGTALVKGVKTAIGEASELEQNLGGAHAVFGDALFGSLESKATEAYKNMGLSASDYYATANKMGSLFQGSGLSQQKSLDLTTAAMQRAADVASVMGIDTSMAMESIAGAAKGNFTMMDNLGVAMNATTLSAYALEKGVNFDWNTASNAEKAELAMQMFMEKTAQYEGNFARESAETFSGSFAAMQASFQDFMGNLAIGENVSESLSNLMTSTATFFFGNFIPMLGTIFKSLPGAIATFLSQGVPLLLTNVSTMITNFANTISTAAQSLTAEKVQTWITTTLPRIVMAGARMIGKFVSTLLQNLPKVVSAIGRIGTSIVTGLGSAIWGRVSAAAQGILSRFMAPINRMKDRVKGVVDRIKGFFPISIGRLLSNFSLPHLSLKWSSKDFGPLGSIRYPTGFSVSWYAKGGIVQYPTVFGAIGMGEAGAEAIVPLDPFWKRMDEMAESMQGGDITINVYAQPGMDVKDLAMRVRDELVSVENRRRLAWQ